MRHSTQIPPPHPIIANVGDHYSDLAGGHEDKAFKLTNPFYFLP